jgi:hypothetical protein
MRSFAISIILQTLLGRSNEGGWQGMEHVVRMEEMRNAHTILVGKSEEKRSFSRRRKMGGY